MTNYTKEWQKMLGSDEPAKPGLSINELADKVTNIDIPYGIDPK
ncbi:MAG: hypothetical protein DHS20C02_04100 [Micavibrio sp.]|nr:MAG: hypothetical protein DHS20C02_04100 [Micavibrio sp.]